MIRSIALIIAIVLFPTSIVHASVRITEIAWMGTAESQFGEWFELYNDSSEAINLAGWKLYEAGGDTAVFTLTKSIPAQGYLLVERTTTSSPDPIPAINDESGPFGGSGFSNTGEHLVLKDTIGTTVQSLNFLSGWSAGSTETKQTMQWDDSKWVTAVATPKTTLQSSGGGDVIPPVPNPVSSGTAWSEPRRDPYVELSIPKTIYTTVSLEYSAKTMLEYQDAYTGVFLWNMGDGSTYRTDTPKSIKHTYAYPGTYTISFAYYKNFYDKKPFLFTSLEKTVGEPQIAFKVIVNKGFSFTNNDSVPVDISGWVIISGENIVELPPFTIIAPKKTVVMPFSAFGIAPVVSATLQTPERTSLHLPVSEIAATSTVGTRNSSETIQAQENYNIEKANVLAASVIDLTQADDIAPISKNRIKTVIFIVVLLIVIGLFIVLEKVVVSRQEE